MAATAATATSASSSRSARPVGRPRARRAVGVEGDGRPRAPERQRGGRGHHGDRGREHEVGGVEPEQRAEQQPVDHRAGLEDVAGEDHAGGERGHQQQGGGLAVARVRARRRARPPPAYPSATASAGEHGAEAGGVGHHQAGEGGRAHGVREERQPAQHDPGAEHAARHGQQHQLEQRLAQERQIGQVQGRRHRPSLTRMILNKARTPARRAASRMNFRDVAWSSRSCCSERWCPPGRSSSRFGSCAAS